jgi:hypothetical protein
MTETDEITLVQMLRAIPQLRDFELLQLKAAARKEMEKRNLKSSRHVNTAGVAVQVTVSRARPWAGVRESEFSSVLWWAQRLFVGAEGFGRLPTQQQVSTNSFQVSGM